MMDRVFTSPAISQQSPSLYLQQGVPMVATSPVRHEPPPNLAPNPIDVQAYQAPWKTLGDYAMGPLGPHDLDHPVGQAPFQQLVRIQPNFSHQYYLSNELMQYQVMKYYQYM